MKTNQSPPLRTNIETEKIKEKMAQASKGGKAQNARGKIVKKKEASLFRMTRRMPRPRVKGKGWTTGGQIHENAPGKVY